MDLSATLNVLYLDGFQLDSESAAPLMKLFSNLTNYKFDNFTSMGKHFFNKGNLYMYINVLFFLFYRLIIYSMKKKTKTFIH